MGSGLGAHEESNELLSGEPTEDPATEQRRAGRSVADAPLRPGVEVAGRYRMLRPIGAGGMGEVWEALHIDIGKPVALKLLSARTDGHAAERFFREARVLAEIEHPNIVRITDYGETDEGVPFMAMQLVRGRPLSAILRAEAPLPWPRARSLLLQIVDALEVAHEHGIVHRDVKPANVLVVDEPVGGEKVKLIDFGIAKSFELDARMRKLTRTGVVFGSPAYMSPEQARAEAVDARSDIYSLGCVAYEMLCGRLPFPVESPYEQLYRRLYEEVGELPPGPWPPAFAAGVVGCLRRDPSRRLQTMADVRRAFEGVDATEGRGRTIPAVVAAPRGSGEAGPPRPRARGVSPVSLFGAAFGVAAVVALGLWGWQRYGRPGPLEPTPPPARVPAPAAEHADAPTMNEPSVPADRVPAPPEPVAAGTDDTTGAPVSELDPESRPPEATVARPPRRPRGGARPQQSPTSAGSSGAPAAGSSSAPATESPRRPLERNDKGTFDPFRRPG